MSELRQAILGILAALISSGMVIGALTLSLAERDLVLVARSLASEAPAQVYPSPVIFVDTPAPGEPTFTPSPTPEPSPTAGLPTETPSCVYPVGWTAVTVQPGDTLDSLAQTYATNLVALRSGNCLPVDLLMPGSIVFVPPLPEPLTATATIPPTEPLVPTATATDHICNQPPPGWLAYTVQWGDTLAALARSTGASITQLKKANCMKSDRIIAGQRLWVPRLPPPTPIPYRTPTRIPTLPPTATVPPPTQPPPTAVPPTAALPTPVPPTTAPSITPVPPTETPTEMPVPTTAVPSPTDEPTVVTTTEIPVPTTEVPAGLAATPTPPLEAPTVPPTTEAPALAPSRWGRPASNGSIYSVFAFRSRSVIIHPDGAAKTAPAAISINIGML